MERDGLPRRARALRAAPRGAVRHPVGPRADAAVALRRPRGEGRARRPGRRRAPRRLRPPPGGGRAGSAGRAGFPAARPRRPRARAGRCRARPARRRAARLLGGRGDAERLLRLVEITDHAPARAARRAARGERGRGRAARRSPRTCSPTSAAASLLEQALYLDTRLFLPDGILICNDKMSMAASLELRVPFLDVELMRFVERIPARCAPGARQGKRLHREAMERLLPPEIASRPKHGFATPYDDWLRDVARRGGRAPLRARRAARRARRARAPWRGWSASTAAAAPTTRASSTACSSCPSGTAPSSRRREPVAA